MKYSHENPELEGEFNHIYNLIAKVSPEIGDIKLYKFFSTTPTAVDVPDGWLLCNGQQVNKNTFANLFDKIGYRYNGTPMTNFFELPTLTGPDSYYQYIIRAK